MTEEKYPVPRETVDAELSVAQLIDKLRTGSTFPIDKILTMLSASDDNNNAIVLRLDYGQTSLLLTGDAEQEAEADMMAAGLPLRADVLKIGHHGSKGATSTPFVAAVAPRLAVIQVGAENTFGHPHPDVLAELELLALGHEA